MSEWKPDRSGKYLTVVYRDLIPGDEVGEVIDHPKAVIMSWSNAVDDVQQLSNTTPPQRTWVGLTDEEIEKLECVYALWDDGESCTIMGIKDFARSIEAELKEKNT